MVGQNRVRGGMQTKLAARSSIVGAQRGCGDHLPTDRLSSVLGGSTRPGVRHRVIVCPAADSGEARVRRPGR
jgi:hypothetical protein